MITDAETSRTSRLLIALALGGYGLYRALYVPAMLVGPPFPAGLVGFLLQAVFGILAGISVWRGARSAPILIVLLGASIAATALVEGLFGIIPYLPALLEAVAAIVAALLIGSYVKRLGATATR